jgi:putative transposase
MPAGLKRFYDANHLHYLTCSCYRRQPLLSSPRRRDAFLKILEQVRHKYDFTVVGYVVMPDHFHLLISEPAEGDPSLVMKVLKQRIARRLLPRRCTDDRQAGFWNGSEQPRHFWQKRFYDFNVWSHRKEVEKLRYMHRNPVKRGLVSSPELWRWSSFRFYAYRDKGLVEVNAAMRRRLSPPTQRKAR